MMPESGWLRAIRSLAGLTQRSVGEKISMTRQAYAGLEASEERGAISIASLRRAAEAMDCDLVYSILPRGEIVRTATEVAAEKSPDHEPQPQAGRPVIPKFQTDDDLPIELR